MSLKNLARLFGDLSVASVSRVKQPGCLWDQVRRVSASSAHFKSIRDEHRTGLKIQESRIPLMEGTVGAEKWVTVDTSAIDDRLPTPETMKQLFNGIPYDELPIVHIKATKNNTLMTVTDAQYKLITYTSCRLEGFKNARKKTSIAGQTTGVAAGQRLVRRGIQTVRVKVRGLGPGRMTGVKGLTTAGVQVVSITDFTRLTELGPRPRKIRRV